MSRQATDQRAFLQVDRLILNPSRGDDLQRSATADSDLSISSTIRNFNLSSSPTFGLQVIRLTLPMGREQSDQFEVLY